MILMIFSALISLSLSLGPFLSPSSLPVRRSALLKVISYRFSIIFARLMCNASFLPPFSGSLSNEIDRTMDLLLQFAALCQKMKRRRRVGHSISFEID